MRKVIQPITLFILVLFLITSCNKEEPSDITTRVMDLSAFSGIDLYTSANVRIVKSNQQKVEITGKETVVQAFSNEILNGDWQIKLDDSPNGDLGPIDIVISTDAMKQLYILGSGNIQSTDAFAYSEIIIDGSGNIDIRTNSTELTSTIDGSGSISVSGTADKSIVLLYGSGDFNGFALDSKETFANISSSGQGEVQVSDSLRVLISGSGNIYYKGNPTIIKEITGSGKVIDSN